MLILSEENKKLKGTTYVLPDYIIKIFQTIVKNKIPDKSTAYVKAKNVIQDNGIVTMEWLKNMKHFFTQHQNEADPEFREIGGYAVKDWVDSKLDLITSMCPKEPRKKSITKVRQETSALAGMRGDHSSKSLDISKSLMPKLENKQSNKILIITEEQAKEILKHL